MTVNSAPSDRLCCQVSLCIGAFDAPSHALRALLGCVMLELFAIVSGLHVLIHGRAVGRSRAHRGVCCVQHAFEDVRCIDSSKVSQPEYGRQVDRTDHKDVRLWLLTSYV